ncbi:hypothetical protein [Vibrio harveyi]|uniref:hypothetical protein n=1 Tax=Vibrio harveyi TaxID=669 RepID=UPI0018F1F83E|nr:hypothetical protein [Vibrio harveyi]
MSEIAEAVENLEALLGLPKGFYRKLHQEDDWSFIIKLSALFEAASTEAIASKLQHPEISSALSSLEQAHPRHGKIALMLKLGIISPEQKTFLVKLAELRNKLVHNISEVAFDFETYMSSLENGQKNALAKILGHGVNPTFKIQGVSLNRTDFTIENPKIATWVTANEILACLHAEIAHGVDMQEITRLGISVIENITKRLSQIPNA